MTETRNGQAFLTGLLGGALLGAAVGVVFAPQIFAALKTVRRELTDAVGEAGDTATGAYRDATMRAVDAEPAAVEEPEPVAEAVAAAPSPMRAPEPPAKAVPAWHSGGAVRLDPAAQAAHERLELARAYLDLGDLAGARQLLGEDVINGDHAARQQASRMLRELE